ncbi:restriction endonuclease subunit S [Haloarcula sp. CBA1130]|uniref:restriction endonuclease subunit S n=1 Tax=unclassified Haloarcula TaxID=2624677 RepID=UPI001248C49D|nr:MULTISPECIES: restriction endonuclease subunit S [unclassified Haloarcula]KAA9396255.1 restriction endonuclease subunit S [Haloarcula sp. CBA1130]KAA9398301.1 restriction endonuclease subunit S [Haloarcula sp. CBA1129]
MSDDASQQASLDEIVDEHSGESSETVDAGKIQEIDDSPVEGWDLRRLGEIISLEYGENLTEDERDGGKYPVYGSNGQVGSHSEAYVDRPGIIVGRKGSIGELKFSEKPFYPIDTTYYISQEETDENLRFVYYLLENVQLSRLNAASAVPGLNRNDAYSLKGLIPPLEEQRKIASILYNVEQAIQKTDEIASQTKRVKKGAMQDLFTEGYYDHDEFVDTRAGKIPASWDVDKIKNRTELISGAHVKSDLVYEDDSLTPYLTGPDDFDEFGFTVTKYTNEPTKFCEPDDTLVTVKGSGCGKSTFANQRACISRQLKALRPKSGLDPLYLFYFMKTKQNYLETLAEGSAIPGLSNSHLVALDIPIPSTEEQQKIAETLREFDHQVEANNRYKSQLKRLKRGLMRELLTGEVRTNNRDINVLPEVETHG